MKYTHFLMIVLSCLFYRAQAQAQYGLVIGINKYYQLVNGQKVLDPENSKLKGCVNDAKSIKEILVSRFGFKPADITEMYDFNASEENVRKAIKDLLAKCKQGDVAVVYYSGHGISFPHIDPRTGTQWAEAICTADFNATPLLQFNYIQGSELANLFGQFVDKGVTLTALFDCCHSNSTVRLQKNNANLSGIRTVLDMSAWRQAKEFNVDFSTQTILKVGNISAFDPLIIKHARDTIVHCDTRNNAVALSDWLNRHGGAIGRENKLEWAYKEIKKYNTDCKTRNHQYEFTASDKSGRIETSKADFILVDNTAPVLVSPARDTTITCCGNDYQAAFSSWLSRNGGATATDACSLTWTNDHTEQKNTDLDKTGSTQVIFTATDGCNEVSAKATFTAEDQVSIDNNRISDLELILIVSLLNELPSIKESLAAPKFKMFAGAEQRVSQFQVLEKHKTAILSDNGSSGPVTQAMLEKIQGTPALGELYWNINWFIDLTDPLFNYKKNFVAGIMPVTKPPLDFLIPVSDATDYSDFLKEGSTDLAKEIELVTADTKLFPFEPFGHRPPSKIPGSRFLFMSATDDVQKGVEKKDENKQPHGAFTKALLTILRDNQASLSSADIFNRIKREMTDRFIPHAPSMSISTDRRNGNLFGVSPTKLTDVLTAKCIKVSPDKKVIELNKGLLSGLAPGNVLRDFANGKDVEVEITEVFDNRSIAKVKPGIRSANFSLSALMNTSVLNDEFRLTDGYTISNPLVHVFIPNDSCTAEMQQTILKEHVLTRINANDLRLVRFDRPDTSCRKMFLKGKKYTVIKNGVESAPSSLNKLPKETNIGGNYFLYLPVPTEVATALDQKCLKDQNIALVKSPVAANLSFYCTYSENLKSVIYVVTDQETTGKKRMNNTHTVPYYYFPAIDPKTQKPLSPQQISDNIYNMLLMYASKYGWINKSPKKKT